MHLDRVLRLNLIGDRVILVFRGQKPRTREILSNISNTRNSVSSGYPNTEKRVENTTRSGVFLTKFDKYGPRARLVRG